MNNALLIEVVQRYIDERLGDAFQELGFFTSQHRPRSSKAILALE